MKKYYLYLTTIALLICVSAACQSSLSLPLIQPVSGNGLTETQLGKSKYWLMLPEGFRLAEAAGKEGQLGYSIVPTDEASTLNGFVEIKRGSPVTVPPPGEGEPFARSHILGATATWTLEQTETSYFIAVATGPGGLSARISSKKRDDIGWMISIISTLKEK